MKKAIEHIQRLSVLAPSGCWLYAGSRDHNGYGLYQKSVEGFDQKTFMVHRIAYETYVGPIPEGYQVDHLCRVRWCFNPQHLEAVTAQENTLRSTSRAALNAAKTHCPQGHAYEGYNLVVHDKKRFCRECLRTYTKRAWHKRYAKRQAGKPMCEKTALLTGTPCKRRAKFVRDGANVCGQHTGYQCKPRAAKTAMQGAILKLAEEAR